MDSKRISIFGAGEAGQEALSVIGTDCVVCIIDNNKSGHIHGIPILSLEEFLDSYGDNVKIIVASYKYWKEISAQLENNGICEYLIWQHEYIHYALKIKANGVQTQLQMFLTQLQKLSENHGCIAVYAYDLAVDLIMFVLYAYGQERNVKYIFRHRMRNFRCPESIEKLLSHHSSEERKCFENVKKEIDCLIIAVRRRDIELFDIVKIESSSSFTIVDIYNPIVFFEKCKKDIKRFKNTMKTKRCFVIGNGPSLRIADLDTLHRNKELTFACNKIFLAFDKTEWRPDFYAVTDTRTFSWHKDTILSLDLPLKFFAGIDDLVPDNADCIMLNHCWESSFPNAPRFSDDPGICVYGAGSVVYEICLQMAAYMGFNEIYLLGVDNSMNNNFRVANHFASNYISKEEADYLERSGMQVHQDFINLALKKAKTHSEERGYKIFDATRGGRSVFRPVNFDSLF